MFAALAVPNFRRYVGGQALSLIGTWVETVAQALLVLRLTHSGTILGLTTAARFAPVLALSPYAGLLVDRFPKRRILLITQAGLGLVSLALGVLVLTGRIDIWGVVVLALAFGTLSAVDNPARQAFVSELVGGPLAPATMAALVATTPRGSSLAVMSMRTWSALSDRLRSALTRSAMAATSRKPSIREVTRYSSGDIWMTWPSGRRTSDGGWL